MTAQLDGRLDALFDAVDTAREAATPSPGDEDIAEHLVSVRLQMSVALAVRDVGLATDGPDAAAAVEGMATAACRWLHDDVIQGRLRRMRPRDPAAAITSRVQGAVSELRLLACRLRQGDADALVGRSSAGHVVRAARAVIDDAVVTVQHAG